MQPDLEVRLPVKFVDMVGDGEITPAMLNTITFLYRWADWGTGVVKKVSATGLETWSNHAYHHNTYQDALNRLEKQGHITRHMTPHSRLSYPVTINNFRAKRTVKATYGSGETVMKYVVLNRVNTVTWTEYKEGRRAKTLAETVPDGVDDGVAETGLTVWTEHAVSSTIKQENVQVVQENKQEQQQQPAAAAASSVLSAPKTKTKTQDKPESPVTPDTAPPSPALELAQKFWKHMESPSKFRPASWEKGFSELLLQYSDHVDLGWLLHLAFDGFLSKKWRDRLLQAKYPLAYLKTVLPHIQDDLEDYQTKTHAILAAQGLNHPPDPASPPSGNLEDDEDFGNLAFSANSSKEINLEDETDFSGLNILRYL